MECSKCDYTTDSKKSLSNHLRYGCCGYEKNKRCLWCNRLLDTKRRVSKQGKFCNNKCYSVWRSVNWTGEKATNYKDGRCKQRQLLRARLRFKRWRKSVFQRDKYTCQECGDNGGGNLEAHHIKEFSKYPRLRYKLTNGITLCKKCHKKTKNYGYKKSGHKIQGVG